MHIFHHKCTKWQTLDLEKILKAQNIEELLHVEAAASVSVMLLHCHCGASAPSGDFVKEKWLLTLVFLHLHITCFGLFFVFCFFFPHLCHWLLPPGLQKQGDITTNGRMGGEESWTELKKGERAVIKCPCQQ